MTRCTKPRGVYGRRRQGKTYLLDALTARVGGLLHVAVQDVPRRAIERLFDGR
ncbi:MAG: hypothetical protein ACRDYX_19865 [Egibacteraceae bacterium]